MLLTGLDGIGGPTRLQVSPPHRKPSTQPWISNWSVPTGLIVDAISLAVLGVVDLAFPLIDAGLLLHVDQGRHAKRRPALLGRIGIVRITSARYFLPGHHAPHVAASIGRRGCWQHRQPRASRPSGPLPGPGLWRKRSRSRRLRARLSLGSATWFKPVLCGWALRRSKRRIERFQLTKWPSTDVCSEC